MATGIKEITELLQGLELIAVQAKKVMADGKVNAADLGVVVTLFSQVEVLSTALKGCDQIPTEAKDLDTTEAQAIIAQVLKLAASVKAA